MLESLVEFLAGFGLWNWFFLASVLLAMEVVIPGVHFLWFGLAAAVVGIVAFGVDAAGHGAAFTPAWQLVAYALVSVATLFGVKKFLLKRTTSSDEPSLNVRGAHYIGREFMVENAIQSGRGKVRVGDTLWPAEGADAPAGAKVRVKAVNGTVLVVETIG
ncbi:MAG: NfeD family protein [Hyphomicrobium sp.]